MYKNIVIKKLVRSRAGQRLNTFPNLHISCCFWKPSTAHPADTQLLQLMFHAPGFQLPFPSYLQMSHDAELLRLLQAAGGGGGEFVRTADQEVTCGWVAASLRADIPKLRHQRPDRTPQGCCREERRCQTLNPLTQQQRECCFCFK